jgi:acyl-CoA reductase-like NAD-dependent aldehyde dehydrogenase
VQKSVLDKFMAGLETSVKAYKVGDPTLESTEMGPLVSKSHFDSVSGYLDGANVAFRGSAPEGPGFWFAPTVVMANGLNDRCMTDEIFGPVVTVHAFEDEAEAIEIANSTEFGLSGSIWTRDIGRGIRVARGVESGNLSINSHSSVRYNTPFGGFKQSGLGRELGPDAPLHFTEEKNVFIPND